MPKYTKSGAVSETPKPQSGASVPACMKSSGRGTPSAPPPISSRTRSSRGGGAVKTDVKTAAQSGVVSSTVPAASKKSAVTVPKQSRSGGGKVKSARVPPATPLTTTSRGLKGQKATSSTQQASGDMFRLWGGRDEDVEMKPDTSRHPTGSSGVKPKPSSDDDDNLCVVCMCPIENVKTLEKCGHKFCTPCIDQCFTKMNPVCPICGTVYGKMTGNMPHGTMTESYDRQTQLPGYHGCGTIIIEYNFPSGRQEAHHPHPGHMYHGTHRMAYLPDNPEGRKVLGLLKKSFERKMTFTVGRSATTGLDDQVIWNDVHHKTRIHGGPTSFGYPDPTYLNRVQEELAAKGIL